MNPIPSSSSLNQNVSDQNFSPLSIIPIEIIEKITSYLDDECLLTLAQASRTVHVMFRDRIILIVKKAFGSYGALARCESETNNAQKLIRISSAILGLRNVKALTWAMHLKMLLKFDAKGTPSLLNFDELIESDPDLTQLGGKISFYRGDYLRLIHSSIIKYFQEFKEIYEEFLNQPLDLKRPLQDLRDRAVRIITIENVAENLKCAWTTSFGVHRRFKKATPISEKCLWGTQKLIGYNFTIPDSDFPEYKVINSKEFCHYKRAPLGFEKMPLNMSFKVPVTIWGRLKRKESRNELDGSTVFSIYFRKQKVASCKFVKVWVVNDVPVMENGLMKTGATRENRNRIEMRTKLLQERSTIDVSSENSNFLFNERVECNTPLIKHLFRQLSAEILLKEDFPALRRLENRSHKIGVHSRNRFNWSNSFTMYKSDSVPEVSSSKTKVSRLRDVDGNALLVPFEIEPTTWEEYLNRNGYILGDSKDPVLPKFIMVDFEKLQAPATSSSSG